MSTNPEDIEGPYDEDRILARRNFIAMNEAMKHFEQKRAALETKVNDLERTVHELVQLARQQQTTINLLQALVRGHGSTS